MSSSISYCTVGRMYIVTNTTTLSNTSIWISETRLHAHVSKGMGSHSWNHIVRYLGEGLLRTFATHFFYRKNICWTQSRVFKEDHRMGWFSVDSINMSQILESRKIIRIMFYKIKCVTDKITIWNTDTVLQLTMAKCCVRQYLQCIPAALAIGLWGTNQGNPKLMLMTS